MSNKHQKHSHSKEIGKSLAGAFDQTHAEKVEAKNEKHTKEMKKYEQDKLEENFYKNFDNKDQDQMNLLKKRDIKRYRKELKKIKREKFGPGVQTHPKPIR